MNHKMKIQYLCAVILILSSICLAFWQVIKIDDVANGTLMYIAQAFLLAGSIFGIEYYLKTVNIKFGGNEYKTDERTEK